MYYLETVLSVDEQRTLLQFLQDVNVQPADIFGNALAIFKHRPSLDIFVLDELLSAADPEYDNTAATWRGRETSMSEYIKEKYGDEIHKIIMKLL
jgi:hypothetical protein